MQSDTHLPRPLRWLTQSTPAVAYVLLVVTMLCWAGNFVVGRWIVGHVPPLTLAALRWTGASLLILPLALTYLRRDWPLIRAHAPMLVFLGVMGSGVFNTIQYVALRETTATSAAVINSSGPVMIALAAVLFFGGRLALVQAAGIAVSLVGVAIVLTRGDPSALAALGQNRGDLLMVVAVVGWAFYTSLLHKRPAIHPLSFAAVTYVVAAGLNAPLALGELALGAHVETSASALGAIAYTAIFPSLIAYLAYARGVEIIGATRAGAFMHLIPLFAGLLSMALLGEAPRAYHAAGFAAILIGVFLAARGR